MMALLWFKQYFVVFKLRFILYVYIYYIRNGGIVLFFLPELSMQTEVISTII